ncbi:MAG: hypothetical protein L3J82_10425 [Planctomycetes bacterium]|nr:hypothetical protein [Planctomycetota bacterium]
MIRLSANYTKKVPGSVQYSSEQASASIEIELAEGDTAQVQAKLHELWNTLRGAVDQQLTGNVAPATTQQQVGNTQPRQSQSGRNGQASDRTSASEKQLKFVRSLVGELKAVGVDFTFIETLCDRQFGRKLDHLDRAQASTLIGHLNEVKAGRLSVQQALAA